ncbi:MAG: PQQ-like beta-propeller repeat protein [Planctomycetes bacterium]|nr:PQQ-like beta-propeller repeat protein [Planctomycetota bacterium]
MRNIYLVSFLLATLAIPRPAFAKEENWPQFLGPNRDSMSPDRGLLKRWPSKGPRGDWKVSGIGIGFSSPVICKGMVYVTGDVGKSLVITALDTKGRGKWRKRHDKRWDGGEEGRYPGARSTPTIADGKLYLLSATGLLGCYDAKTGDQVWTLNICEKFGTKPLGFGYSESPLVCKDKVIVTPGGKNCVVALNKENGETIWVNKEIKEPANYSSGIQFEYEGVSLIATMTAKSMICLEADTGKLCWRTNRISQTTRAVCSTPLYHDGYVFGATGYGNGGVCMKLDVSEGKVTAKPVWETKDMDNHHGGYVLYKDHLYGASKSGWCCIDFKTGKTRWTSRGVGRGSIVYADKMLYLFSERGGTAGLVVASPKKYFQTGEFSVPGEGPSFAHPVVIGGRLYLRYGDNLYVFKVKRGR